MPCNTDLRAEAADVNALKLRGSQPLQGEILPPVPRVFILAVMVRLPEHAGDTRRIDKAVDAEIVH